MGRRICIVSVYRPDLVRHCRNALSFGQNIEVIVDRRVGERRSGAREISSDRRRCSLEEELRVQGYALVDQE